MTVCLVFGMEKRPALIARLMPCAMLVLTVQRHMAACLRLLAMTMGVNLRHYHVRVIMFLHR